MRDCLDRHVPGGSSNDHLVENLARLFGDPDLLLSQATETCLRLWQQETIQPAVMKLRRSLYILYPYHDCRTRGGWSVRVQKRDDTVRIARLQWE